MSKVMFSGVYTALITPFVDTKVDFDSLKKIVEFQLENGVDGFVVNGTTGESPSLNIEEVKEIYNQVRSWVPAGFPILLGTGSNSTEKTIDMTLKAKEWGADGALVVTPYYNKPTQEGLYQHFKSISKKVNLPIVLYNVPGRTITSVSPQVTVRLSQLPGVVGIKEASGDLSYIKETQALCSESFLFSSGDDGSFLEFVEEGGHGVISVLSHIIPKKIKELISMDYSQAKTEYKVYEGLLEVLYCESNPIPVKMAMYLMGIIESPEMRLPLTEMSLDNKLKMESVLKGLGII